VGIVFDLPPAVLRERHAGRTDRPFGLPVIRRQRADLHHSLPRLGDDGFAALLLIRSTDEAAAVAIERAGWDAR
jgi:hypothetical protein